jgi:hypothetical protein
MDIKRDIPHKKTSLLKKILGFTKSDVDFQPDILPDLVVVQKLETRSPQSY